MPDDGPGTEGEHGTDGGSGADDQAAGAGPPMWPSDDSDQAFDEPAGTGGAPDEQPEKITVEQAKPDPSPAEADAEVTQTLPIVDSAAESPVSAAKATGSSADPSEQIPPEAAASESTVSGQRPNDPAPAEQSRRPPDQQGRPPVPPRPGMPQGFGQQMTPGRMPPAGPGRGPWGNPPGPPPQVPVRQPPGLAPPMRIEPGGGQHPVYPGTPQSPPQRPPTEHPPASNLAGPPQRVETQPAGEDPTTRGDERPGTKPPRKRRWLIGGAVVLVLVIAAGVVSALPAVSNRLGLPWAPNAPKGAPPRPVAVHTVLGAPPATAPAPSPDGLRTALAGPAGNSALGTLTGTVLDPTSGNALWDKDSSKALTPASTTKLLTVAAALLSVDHNRQLVTKVVAGDQPGSVVLVGGGDITLSSLPAGKESLNPGAAHLDDLVAQVKQATGGQINSVRLDLSAYQGNPTAPGWAPEDAPSTYAANVVPAMLDGGRTNPTDDHSVRVPNPAGTLAQQLADKLGGTVGPPVTGTASPNAKVLGEVRSAPLTELVTQLLQISDNVLAEAVGRLTAVTDGKEASFAGTAQATKDVLTRNGFDLTGVELSDGSGLSTLNKVPARLLGQLLGVAAGPAGKDPRTEKLRPMLAGLPVAGGSGTLADRYTQPPSAAGKGWVRAKTGTLSNVNTLAGVVLDKDARVLVFALMSSGSAAEPGRAALDAVVAKLRECGCG